MKKSRFIFWFICLLLVGCTKNPIRGERSTPMLPESILDEPALVLSPDENVDERFGVEIAEDIVYTVPQNDKVSSERMLDIYAPIGAGNWPVVVFLHGGVGQDKDDQAVTSKMLAQRGFVVFTPTWPSSAMTSGLANHGRGFREIAETLSCAVQFTKARAPSYGGDSTRVILSGFSAGGGAGAISALMGREIDSSWDEYESTGGGPPTQVACLEDGVSAEVFAFVGVGGYYDDFDSIKEMDSELWSLVSYQALIDKNRYLIVRLIHGENDDAAHFWRATSLMEKLTLAGYDVSLISHEGSHYVPRELLFDVIKEISDR